MLYYYLFIILLLIFSFYTCYKYIKITSDAQQRRQYANNKYESLLKRCTSSSNYITNHIGQLRWSHEYIPLFCYHCCKNIPFQNNCFNCIECQHTVIQSNLSQCKGIIIFVHGFGMNTLLSMQKFIEQCIDYNYAFFSLDFDGHGLSDGLGGYLHSNSNIMIQDLTNYILYVINKVYNHNNNIILEQIEGSPNYPPIHIVGFSIGATCSLLAIHRVNQMLKNTQCFEKSCKKQQDIISSIVLVAPFQYTAFSFLPFVLGMIAYYFWKPIYSFYLSILSYSPFITSILTKIDNFLQKYNQHFPNILDYQEYLNCPVVYKSFPSFTSCIAINQLCRQLSKLINTCAIQLSNVLVLHGEQDTIASVKLSTSLFNSISCSHLNNNAMIATTNSTTTMITKVNNCKKINNMIIYPNVKHTVLFGNIDNIQQKIYQDIFNFF